MPFSQTMRSLGADRARLSLIGVFTLMLLVLLWLAWFFLAPIPLYESSGPLRIPLEEGIMIDFPAEYYERIKPGQAAVLYLEANGDRAEMSLPATVIDITADQDDGIQVWLMPDLDDPSFYYQDNIVKQVDIEVSHITPVLLITQSSWVAG